MVLAVFRDPTKWDDEIEYWFICELLVQQFCRIFFSIKNNVNSINLKHYVNNAIMKVVIAPLFDRTITP